MDMHADGGLQRLFDEAWTKYEALRSDVGAASLYFWTSAKTICGSGLGLGFGLGLGLGLESAFALGSPPPGCGRGIPLLLDQR